MTIAYLLAAQTLLFYPAYRYSKSTSLSPFVMFYIIMFLVNLMRGVYLNFAEDVSVFKYFIVNVDKYEFEYGALVVLVSCIGIVGSTLLSNSIRFKSSKKYLNYNHSSYNRSVYAAFVAGMVILALILLLSTNPGDFSSKRSYGFAGEETSFGPLRFVLNILLFGFQFVFFMKLFNKVKLND